MRAKSLKIAAWITFALMLAVAAGCGAVYGFMQTDRPAHTAAAEDITRTLARTWRFATIENRFSQEGRSAIDPAAAQRALDGLEHLGPLVHMKPPAVYDYDVDVTTSAGLVRTSMILFTAHFHGGSADISIIVTTADGVTKVQHLHIKPRPKPAGPQPRSLA